MKQGFEKAQQARSQAYAPYSKFFVGASVKACGKDEIFSGANIENSSYGATVCAERVALWQMVYQMGSDISLEWVCVVTDTPDLVAPCGQCLQVISEFSDKNTKIYSYNLKGDVREDLFLELMPRPFYLK